VRKIATPSFAVGFIFVLSLVGCNDIVDAETIRSNPIKPGTRWQLHRTRLSHEGNKAFWKGDVQNRFSLSDRFV